MNTQLLPNQTPDHRWRQRIGYFLLVTIGILLGCALFLFMLGYDPVLSLQGLWLGSFGSPGGRMATLERWSPVILTGLSALYAFRCGFINLGGEGQLLAGATSAAWFALTFPELPAEILIPAALMAAMAGGALPALMAAVLRVRRRINEALSSLLLNAIIFQLFELTLRIDYPGKIGAWKIPLVGLKNPLDAYPRSPDLPLNAHLPVINGISLALPLSLLIILCISLLLFKTSFGFQSRVAGKNPAVAAYAGYHHRRNLLLTGLISGGIAGLAGGMEVLGTRFQLISGLLNGTGFEGITAAILAGFNPLGLCFSTLFLAALRAGSNRMQILSGAPYAILLLLQAFIILLVLSGIQGSVIRKRFTRILSRIKPSRAGQGHKI